MPWSDQQISTVREATFARAWRGYEPQDVERLRERVLVAMENGRPLEDLDVMALRRSSGMGYRVAQVDGLRTVLAVWRATTPIEDPRDVARRERQAAAAAFAEPDAASGVMRWSSEQIDQVRDTKFPRVGVASTAYSVGDVDAYVHQVIAAMRQGLPIPDPTYARFDSAGLRRGYDPRHVDEFLDALAAMQPEG